MVQEIILIILFVLALAYIGRLVFNSFRSSSSGCAKGCSSCALDMNKLEEQLKKQEAKK